MKKLLIISATLLALAASTDHANAQCREWALPYGYGSSLEMQIGWAGGPFSINGEQKTASGIANGVDFTLRYTYYIGRYVGIYGSLSGGSRSAGAMNYFNVVNKADGNKYVYNGNYNGDYNYSYYLPLFMVGPAFRYDWSRWSLRPRVGIGVGRLTYYSDYYDYSLRSDHVLAGATLRELGAGRSDFLAETDSYRYSQEHSCGITSFAAGGSLQLAYTFRQHCYIYLEAGCTALVSPASKTDTYYPSMDAYHPENWAQAVYMSEMAGKKTIDYDNGVEATTRCIAGLNVTASIGIGWNIGWNRNENGWYWRK